MFDMVEKGSSLQVNIALNKQYFCLFADLYARKVNQALSLIFSILIEEVLT